MKELAAMGLALWLAAPLMGSATALAHDDGDETADPPTSGEDEAKDEAGKEGEKEEADWDVATADLGPTQTLKFTVEEGTWLNVDVSPDGQWIVFDLLGDLYRLPIGGGKAERIRGGRAFDTQPRFSPDGQRIAFTSDAGGGDNLWVAAADGTDARAVTEEDYRLLNSPAWHPSGAFLAGRKHFTSRRSAGAGEVWLYDVARGGEGVQLVERPTDQKDLGEPVFSPDGRHLYYSLDVTPGKYFEYNKDPNQTIYAIHQLDLITGETDTLAGGAGGSIRPQISPDGRSLAFVKRIRGRSVLTLQDLDTGAQRALYDGLSVDQQESWAIFGPYPGFDFTPDGKAIVVWAQGQIMRVDVATGQARPIPFSADVEQEVVDALRFAPDVGGATLPVKAIRWPTISPDGSKVVFQALGRLWIRGVGEATPARLTSGDALELSPSWSPDSKRVVFATWDDVRGGQVRSVSVKGRREQIHAARPGHYKSPSYSPDGSQIVYQRLEGNRLLGRSFGQDPGIYVVDARGGEPRLVSREGQRPAWSGEGDRLLLMAWTPDVKTLYSVDLLGGNRRDLATSERAAELTLSPDGRWIAFRELWDVYVAPRPLSGGPLAVGPKMRSLPAVKVSDVSGAYLSWSPDSTELRFSLGPTLSRVEVPPLFEGPKTPDLHREDIALGWEAAADIPSTDLALVGATLLTMNDGQVIEDGVVYIRGNRIAQVGPRGQVDYGSARVIDVSGKVLMPGFVDIHAHIDAGDDDMYPQQSWPYLANLAFGVTTTHDPSNDTELVFASAERVAAGELLGPRIFSTGTVLYGAEAEFKAVVNSLDDATRHLKRQKAWGAWSVKSYNQPRREQRQQIIRAGRDLEMMVVPEGGSTFVHNLTEILDGHTTIEHSIPIAPLYDDVLTLFARSGTAYTPTLNVAYGGLMGENWWYAKTDVWTHERLGRFVPREVVDPPARRGIRAPDSEYHHIEVARSAAEIYRRGGIVEVGSHGQMQGLGTHWEIWSFAQGGLKPLEVLDVATMGGARALGLDGSLGSIAEGKLADLIVLDRDPREDIHNTDSVALVMINGRLYDAATLNQIAPTERPLPKGPAWMP